MARNTFVEPFHTNTRSMDSLISFRAQQVGEIGVVVDQHELADVGIKLFYVMAGEDRSFLVQSCHDNIKSKWRFFSSCKAPSSFATEVKRGAAKRFSWRYSPNIFPENCPSRSMV